MPYCPECQAEYVEGVEVCPDCLDRKGLEIQLVSDLEDIPAQAEARRQLTDHGEEQDLHLDDHPEESPSWGDAPQAKEDAQIEPATEILNILKSSIPYRFQNIDPYEFERFITRLFNDMGYIADTTQSSSDYGGDVLLSDGSEKTIVQVKRYRQGNKVGVEGVNQVIGAKDYYSCHGAIFITTSGFTQNAKQLAERANVDLWDWEKLYDQICKLYLGDKDVYEYFDESYVNSHQAISVGNPDYKLEYVEEYVKRLFAYNLEIGEHSIFAESELSDLGISEDLYLLASDIEDVLGIADRDIERMLKRSTTFSDLIGRIKKELFKQERLKELTFEPDHVRENVPMEDGSIATIVHLKVSNPTHEKAHVAILNPQLIDSLGNQFEAYGSFSGSFSEGNIYPGASVPVIWCWHSWQVPGASAISRVVIPFAADSHHFDYDNNELIHELSVEIPDSVETVDETIESEEGSQEIEQKCFVVTYCYGRGSPEYWEMIQFRDHVLEPTILGRMIVRLYYLISPNLVRLSSHSKPAAWLLRSMLAIPVSRLINRQVNGDACPKPTDIEKTSEKGDYLEREEGKPES